MKVDFNNLRVQLVREYEELVCSLNRSIKDGVLEIDAANLRGVLWDMRMSIATVALYSNGTDDVKDVLGDKELTVYYNDED